MATDLVPRTDLAGTEPGHLGVAMKRWLEAHAGSVYTTALMNAGGSDASTPAQLAAAVAHSSLTYPHSGARDRSGFVNRTDSAISWDNGSRAMSVAGTFDVYVGGTKYSKAGTYTAQAGTSAGLYFFYFGGNGSFARADAAWDITGTNAPAAMGYWDGTNGNRMEERHSYNRDRTMHQWAHDTIGARYESGLAGTFSATALSVSSGNIHDEDIEISVSGAGTACRLWRRQAGGAELTFAPGTVAAYTAGGTLSYDNVGTMTPVSVNSYVTSWVYYTNDMDYPVAVVVSQAQYASLPLARSAAQPTFPNMSSREWKLIYQVIFRQTAGAIQYTEATDYRTSSSLPGGAVTALPASSVTFTPTGNIAASNVQAALAELDSEKVDAAGTGGVAISGTTVYLGTSGVTAGTYNLATLMVDQFGRLTGAANGTQETGGGGACACGWQVLAGTDYNGTMIADNTVRMLVDRSGTVLPGYGLRYVISGGTRYGQCSTYTGTSLVFTGESGTVVAGALSQLSWRKDGLYHLQLFVSGPFADGTTGGTGGLIGDDMYSEVIWHLPKARVTYVDAKPYTDDTGAAQAVVQCYVGGTTILTGGITLTDSAATSAGTGISVGGGILNKGSKLELGVPTTKGSNADSVNLTVNIGAVLEA